jgi:hypothetical protein
LGCAGWGGPCCIANVLPFTGRGRADGHSNHSERAAAAVQCSGGLSSDRIAVTFSVGPDDLEQSVWN